MSWMRHRSSQPNKQDPYNGGHWAAVCAMQWFNSLESVDYNYAFFWLKCTATLIPWNGIKDT